AEVRPGERVLDYCAGAGGKTLALGASLRGASELWTWDVHPEKLARMQPRLDRVALDVPVHLGQRPPERSMDCVFVDAPCSGSGTLRRDPCLRWRLDATRVDAMNDLQDTVLAEAASYVAPGGRLVYGTCSVFARENTQRV